MGDEMMKNYYENYTYFSEYNAKCFTKGRGNKRVKYIVIHHWGELGQSFEGVLSWFCASPSCKTSAHYIVEEGRVACLVNPSDTAYHAGNWAYNEVSIGIECRPEASEGDYITTAKLISELWQVYGRLPLLPHKAVPGQATSCPGRWSVEKLERLAIGYYEAKSTKASNWAKASWDRLIDMGILDGKRPHDFATREEVATMLYRLEKTFDEKLKNTTYL